MTTQEEEYQATIERTLEAVNIYIEKVKEKNGKEVICVENVLYADSDYLVYINKYLNHFLEVKCRRHKYGKFMTTKVPLRKHSTAEHFYIRNKIKTYFLCYFSDDTLCVLDLTKEPNNVSSQVARHDRGEEKDVYAFYDIDRFTIIS